MKVIKENMMLKEKISKLEHKLDMEEKDVKNLIFYNIPSPQGQTETWADWEGAILLYLLL